AAPSGRGPRAGPDLRRGREAGAHARRPRDPARARERRRGSPRSLGRDPRPVRGPTRLQGARLSVGRARLPAPPDRPAPPGRPAPSHGADMQRLGADANARDGVAAILDARVKAGDLAEAEPLRLLRELGKIATARLHQVDQAQAYWEEVIGLVPDDREALAAL